MIFFWQWYGAEYLWFVNERRPPEIKFSEPKSLLRSASKCASKSKITVYWNKNTRQIEERKVFEKVE